uniref:Uncharacterized protein n=1 Tax=Lepeophtheirus salmonis TaxID=72036 RepID=A0A0K2TIJ9_LEPSM
MTNFMGLFRVYFAVMTSFMIPNKRSVARFLSCASSITTISTSLKYLSFLHLCSNPKLVV